MKEKHTFSEKMVHGISRNMPDAFPLAFILLIIVITAAYLLTDSSLVEILGLTAQGTVSMWEFTCQIAVYMALGCVLANSPPVERLMKKIAKGLGTQPKKVIFLLGLISNIIHWFNGTIGMIGCAVIAKEVLATNKRVKPGLTVLAAYQGLVVHSIGLTPAIFLSIATPGHQFESLMGIIPSAQTIYWLPNLILSGLLIIGMPLVTALAQPADYVNPNFKDNADHTVLENNVKCNETESSKFVRYVESSRSFSILMGVLMLISLACWRITQNVGLSFDTIIVAFLGLSLILWGSMEKVALSMKDGITTMASVFTCYLIYAAIMTVMIQTGIGNLISNMLASMATKDTLPVFVYLSAGVVNIFIPSAGGQWIAQAPAVVPAAAALGTGFHKVAAAVALGDTWTNLVQPFWAIPALSICNVKVKEMIPYSLGMAVFVGAVTCFVLGFIYPMF